MNVYFKIAGIQNGNYPFVEDINIGSTVTLKHEKENKYDPNAIKVLFNDIHIGYIPKTSNKHMKPKIKDSIQGFTEIECNLQEHIIKNNIQKAIVTFVKKPENGYSHSIELTLEKTPPFAFVDMVKLYRYYNKKGEHENYEYMNLKERKKKGLYLSITSFLSHFESSYEVDSFGIDRLREYQATRTDQHVLDAQARYGTLMHEFIEYQIIGTSKTAEKIKKITNGLTFKHAEHTVYDDDLMLAGTYDARFDDIIFDWKSGKTATRKHKLQISFYCKNENVSEGRIIYFGVQNKQGYRVTSINNKQINEGYQFIKKLA